MDPRADGLFPYERQILVCIGKSCNENGIGEEIRQELKSLNKEVGNKERIRVCSVSCLDLCDGGPNIVLWPGGRTMGRQTREKARRLYEECAAALSKRSGAFEG